MRQLRNDDFLHGQAHRGRRAGHRQHHLRANEPADGPAEHGGRTDLLVAQPAEQLAVTGDFLGEHLPNANDVFYAQQEQSIGGVWAGFQKVVETIFAGRLGNALEQWEYNRKLRRFATKMQQPNSAAQIDASHVKGHFEDHGSWALREYRARLKQYNLDSETSVLMAGDLCNDSRHGLIQLEIAISDEETSDATEVN